MARQFITKNTNMNLDDAKVKTGVYTIDKVKKLLENNKPQEIYNIIKEATEDNIESVRVLINQLILEKKIAYVHYKPILKKQLQTALLIEHSTIPPYLTAMYSIHDGKNTISNQIIRSVVVEEMLHMIMVCNVMNALDLKPSVNKQEDYPYYPSKLPLNVAFLVNLEKFCHNSISSFIAIEKPDKPLVKAPITKQAFRADLLMQTQDPDQKDKEEWRRLIKFAIEEYILKLETIGQFYTFLQDLIVLLDTSYKGELFVGSAMLQITPEQYYGSGGNLVVINDIEDVKEAFKEIMDQGEGAEVDEQATMYNKDISQFDEGYELSHYYRFKEILHEHFYIGGDYSKFIVDNKQNIPITTPPNGKPLKVDWSAVYPMKTNAKLADYASNPELLEEAREFNKTYKRLLDAIQAAIEGKQEELPKSIMYMHALREQAVSLMKQPLNANQNAAPTFEYINV